MDKRRVDELEGKMIVGHLSPEEAELLLAFAEIDALRAELARAREQERAATTGRLAAWLAHKGLLAESHAIMRGEHLKGGE